MSRKMIFPWVVSSLLICPVMVAATAGTSVAGPESPAEQYRQLVEEYEDGGSPAELAGRFLKLAEDHPRDPIAVEALVWVLKKRRTRPEAGRALELLTRDHGQSEKIAATFRDVRRTPSLKAEALLRAVLEKNPHRDVRAQACSNLATLLERHLGIVEELKKDPELAARVVRSYGKEYGDYLVTLDAQRVDAKREKVYERMLESFADVPASESTMGEVARAELFKIRHLSVGRVPPEIGGEDIFGKKFRLGDYRGKVVVLSFWGHW